MPKTPDRFPGARYEEEIFLESLSGDPTVAGQVRNVGGTFRVVDSGGVFSLRDMGNVTNDAQLKRAAGDFATFTEKTTPDDADLVLIEDSADGGSKKKVQISNISGFGGSVILTSVVLSPWVDNTIAHGLGRPYIGFIPIRPRGVVCNLRAGLTASVTMAQWWNTVPLDTTSYDLGGHWDVVNHQMLAPVSGDYQFSAAIEWNTPPVGTQLRLGVNVAGSRYELHGSHVSATHTYWPVGESLTRLRTTSGSIIKLEGYHEYAGTVGVWPYENVTRLHVALIDDGIRESPTTNPAPQTNILLRVSYTQTVDLMVF